MIFVSLNKKLNKKVLLLILDGWGIADNKDASAPDKANTPNFNSLIENYPNNFLNHLVQNTTIDTSLQTKVICKITLFRNC